MSTSDDLKIFLQTALDIEASIKNVTADFQKLQERFRNYKLKIQAELDKTASKANINRDIKGLKTSDVKVTGKLDKSKTKKAIKETLKTLQDAEVNVTGNLDGKATAKKIQEQLAQSPVNAKVSVEATGQEQVDSLSASMEKAKGTSLGFASNLNLVHEAIRGVKTAFREAINTINELDASATDIAMLVGNGRANAYSLIGEYNELAKDLHATTKQVNDAAVDWIRQGKSMAETATLIEQSLVFSKVAMIDSSTATKNLTSAMKGYGLAVEDVASIVDKLAALDSKAAVTANDLAVAMSKTASSANIGGVSMDRLLGYIAAVQETTQKSAEVVGESIKTIFARMGNVKLGRFLDDDGEDLSDVEATLSHYGIALRNAEGDFRNFGTVLDEVYARWDKFAGVDMRTIAQAFAGTRQQENFLVLMQNYGKALEYAGVAADSSGVAMKKFMAYEDSIAAKANEFAAAMEGLTLDTFDSELIKDIIDAGTAMVEFADRANLLKTTLIALGTGATLKGIQAISSSVVAAKNNVLNLGTAIQTLRNVEDVTKLSSSTIKTLGTLTKGLSDDQLKLVLTSNQLTAAQMRQILMASGLSRAEADARIQTLGLAQAETAATGATGGLSAAFTGLGAAIKASMASNPIGWIMLGVSALLTLGTAVDSFNQKAREAREATISQADAASNLSGEITDLTGKYLALTEAVKTDTSSKEQLLSTQNELIDKLGIERDKLRELTDEYGNLSDAIKAATIDKLQESERDLRGGLNAHEETVIDVAKPSKVANKSLNHIITSWAKDETEINRKALDALAKAGLISSTSYGSRGAELYLPATDEYDLETVEGVINAYERLAKMLDIVADNAGSDNEVYKALYSTYSACTDAIKGYRDGISALNQNLAEQYMLQGLIGKEIPNTQEDYDAYRQSVIEAAKESGEFIGTETDIANAIDAILSKQTQFAGFYETISEGTQEIEEVAAALTDLTEKFADAETNIGKLGTALKEFSDDGTASIKTIDGIGQVMGELDSFEDFAATLMDTNSTMEQAQEAANKLAGEYIDSSDALQMLTEGNEALVRSMLNKLGVTNTDEVVESRLAGVRAKSKLETLGLANATYEEAKAALEAAGASEAELNSLRLLEIAQLNAAASSQEFINGNSATISSMLAAAKAAGIQAETMAKLAQLEDSINAYKNNPTSYIKASITQLTKDIQGDLANALAEVQAVVNTPISVSVPKTTSTTKSSSTSTTDRYIANVDRFYKATKRLTDEQERAAEIESKLERTHNLEDRLKLHHELEEAYEAEKSALHDLNGEYDTAIQEGVDILRARGFEVKYDPDSNDLFIENLKHLRELTSKDLPAGLKKFETSTDMSLNYLDGQYKNYTEAVNALVKDTEGIISNIQNWNKANKTRSSDDWWEAETKRIQSWIKASEEIVSDLENRITLNENWLDNAINDRDYSGIEKRVNDVIGYYKRMQDEVHAQAEYYRALGYADTSDEVSKLSALWYTYHDAIKNAAGDAWDEVVENMHTYVDGIQNVYETLHSAAEQYAETGVITLDTWQEILRLGPQYMQYLRQENGHWVINEESIRKVIKAQTEELALENAIAYVKKIKVAAMNGEQDTLNQLVLATNLAASATWDYVMSELDAIEMSDELREAARYNIQALRDFAIGAADSIGKTAGATNDLLQYIMDMIEQRVRDQIDYLREVQQAYRDLIAEKKESLRASKNEADYQKKMADYTKKLAQYQAKIDMLGLAADSGDRKAQAERAKLMEEMASLQDEVNSYQEDHTIEAQEKLLDELEKTYCEEKDREIDALEDSVSSTEKIYRKALDYLENEIGGDYNKLKNQLISYNEAVGRSFNAQIVNSWTKAIEEAKHYKSLVEAIKVDRELGAGTSTSISGTGTSVPANAVAKTSTQTTATASKTSTTSASKAQQYAANEVEIRRWVKIMQENSEDWLKTDSKTERAELERQNKIVTDKYLPELGLTGLHRGDDGIWYLKDGRKLYDVYGGFHEGGFVRGNGEQLALLKGGEFVLTRKQFFNLSEIVDRFNKLSGIFSGAPTITTYPKIQGTFNGVSGGTVNNVTTNNRPVTINIGDTVIHGESGNAVQKHIHANRELVNEIARLIGHKQ